MRRLTTAASIGIGLALASQAPAVVYTYTPIAAFQPGEIAAMRVGGVNASSQVAFITTRNVGGVLKKTIWLGSGGLPTALLSDNGTFDEVGFECDVNDSGTVAFLADALPSSPSYFELAYYTIAIGSSPNHVGCSGQLDGVIQGHYPAINNAGDVACRGFWEVPIQWAILRCGSSSTTPILLNTPPPNSILVGFVRDMNASGFVCFDATISGAYGIHMGNGGAPTPIAVGTAVGGPRLNDNNVVVYRDTLGSVNVIQRYEAGSTTTFESTVGPYLNLAAPTINNAGTIAFHATLDAGGHGVFTGPDPIADKVLRTGDALLGSTVTQIAGNIEINNSGQIAFTVTLADGRFVIVRADADTDGDGLLDDWEDNGIPYTDAFGVEQRYILDDNGDGINDAEPTHKDLFIEIDAMNGLAPDSAAMQKVVNAFATAPVGNPDNNNGIALHLVLDDVNIPVAGWTKDDTNGNGEADWPTEFDALKLTADDSDPATSLAGYFGTAFERADSSAAEIRQAKRKAYRYCIFAKEIDPAASTSGIAELPGNDFIVSLGNWANGSPGGGGTSDDRAGTLMHELGHTLNFKHGGSDHINSKPNYYSVMNYQWQTPLPWMSAGTWPLDASRPGYSTFALLTLDETALNECFAMVVPGSSLAGVVFAFSNLVAGVPAVVDHRFDLRADWNGSGGECESSVAVDVNRIPAGADPSPGEALNGHDDWAALLYDFRGTLSYPDGVHNPDLGAEAMQELDFAEHQALASMLPPFCAGDVNADRLVNVADLLAVITSWGACPPPSGCLADIAPLPADGQVGVADLLAVIGAWGPCL